MKIENIEKEIATLVKDIYQRLCELHNLYGDLDTPSPNSPGRQDTITEVERVRTIVLPDDYKTFLLLHNGWPKFSGEKCLLSAEQLISSDVLDSIRELQSELLNVGQKNAAMGFAIEGSFGASMTYFDVIGAHEPGRFEVVYWGRHGEVQRYPSFTAYLQGYKDDLDEMIANEKANIR